MTNGHPGAGGPFEQDWDERFADRGGDRAAPPGPPGRPDLWAPRPGGAPQPPPGHGQQWNPGMGRGRLDPLGGPPPAPPGHAPAGPPPTGGGFGQPAPPPPGPWPGPAYGPPPGAGRDATGPTGPIPPANPGAFDPHLGSDRRAVAHEYPGQGPWAGQGSMHEPGVGRALGRYPPVGGYADRDVPAGPRGGGWQDPTADVWASPGAPAAAHGWHADPAGQPPWGGDDPLYATQPGSSRARRQRVAAAGGARVRRVWPQRLVLVALVAVAMVVCWYWVFPWLENILPSEF